MSFELTWEPGGVYRRFDDTATIADRRRSVEMICADPRFDDLRYAITDYLAINDIEVSSDTTAEIAALHVGPMRTNPNIIIATVAVNPEAVAMAREFISLGFIDQPQQVFASVAAARAWIAEVGPTIKLRFRRWG